jgi:hypothetical protein
MATRNSPYFLRRVFMIEIVGKSRQKSLMTEEKMK